MKTLSRLAAAAIFLVPATAPAQQQRLDGREMDGIEISATLPGMTMVGNYGNGVRFAETYFPNGTVDYTDDSASDKGRWFVRGRLFCTFYEKADGACFSVRKSGPNCYEYFTQEEEDGSIHKDAGAWNSVGWDSAKPSSCDLSDKTS